MEVNATDEVSSIAYHEISWACSIDEAFKLEVEIG
jgi:hypothetical protein